MPFTHSNYAIIVRWYEMDRIYVTNTKIWQLKRSGLDYDESDGWDGIHNDDDDKDEDILDPLVCINCEDQEWEK